MALALVALSGCASTSSQVRTWVDEQTAVTVTAQKNAGVFVHANPLTVGNSYDFVGVGAFEVNQTGQRRQYLSLMEWGTLLLTSEQQLQIEDTFKTFTIWADGQPLTFTRLTQDRKTLLVNEPLFSVAGIKRREAYYEISVAQLV